MCGILKARQRLSKMLDYKIFTATNLRSDAFAAMEDKQICKNLQNMQEEIARAPGNAAAAGIIEAYYGKQLG